MILRFFKKVNTNGPIPEFAPHLGPCWLWTGAIGQPSGYAQIYLEGRVRYAHVVGYHDVAGYPIPEGYDLDHLCRVRSCVRFDHLEPVTHSENMRRSPSRWKGGISFKPRTPRKLLTPEEREARRRAYRLAYYEANKERLQAYGREYMRARKASR